jgi:hypothetical protein
MLLTSVFRVFLENLDNPLGASRNTLSFFETRNFIAVFTEIATEVLVEPNFNPYADPHTRPYSSKNQVASFLEIFTPKIVCVFFHPSY